MEQREEPKNRPSRRKLTLVVTPLVSIIVIGTVGQAFFPALLRDHPLLLVAFEPRNRNLLLVAGREGGIDFLPFVVVAAIRRMLSDPLYYLLGHWYGDAAVRWIEDKMGEGGSFVRRVEGWFQKSSVLMVFLFPGALVCALAGSTGMSPALFAVLNVAGTVTVVTLMYHLSGVGFIAAPLEWLTGFITGNAGWLTVVSVVLTLVWLWDQRRRGTSEIEGVGRIEDELEAEERELEVEERRGTGETRLEAEERGSTPE